VLLFIMLAAVAVEFIQPIHLTLPVVPVVPVVEEPVVVV
jgi:hypothetical protein